MSVIDRIRRNEIMVLQREENTIRRLLEKYHNALNRLQVEGLTLQSMLGRIQDVDLKSRTATPLLEPIAPSNPADLKKEMAAEVSIRHESIDDEIQVNQSTLDLNAAPMIHRMLHDTELYEDEEEEEEEDEIGR